MRSVNVTFTSHLTVLLVCNQYKILRILTSNSVFYALICFHHTAETQSDVKSFTAPVHGRSRWSQKPDEGWTCGNTVVRTTAIRFLNKVLAQNDASLSPPVSFSPQTAQTDLSGLCEHMKWGIRSVSQPFLIYVHSTPTVHQ